jgi:signal recognition particle subunit SRP68
MDASFSSPPNLSISRSEIQYLRDLLFGEVQRYRALVELSNLDNTARKSEEGSNKITLAERLNQYPSKEVDMQNLVQWPPKLEPVPVKPLFFDAAWNYIEYPGQDIKQAATNGPEEGKHEATAQQTTQQKKGWFGFGR